MLIERGDKWRKARNLRITAIRDTNSRAVIDIKRIHRKAEHAIDVRFEGNIEKKRFRQFINYLEKNLEVLDVTE